MIKKIFPYILIVLIVVQLLAPFSVGRGVKDGLGVESNKVSAEEGTFYHYLMTEVADPTHVITSQAKPTFEECEALKTPKVIEDLEKLGFTVGPCTSFTNSLGPNVTAPNENDIDGFPSCSIWHTSTYGGCIGIGLYWLFFKSTSFVFELSGRVLDFTLFYSINDTSYRSPFVVQGWGIVRDFCNMFFIFVLLYIAFGTILKLNGVKTKEMIINVVIIGLLINFSLFATQVIIDASNILTRVFYNQNTIITGTQTLKDAEDKPILDNNNKPIIISELGESGEIKLSEAIVSKVDPQKLIIKASTVDAIPQKGVDEGEQPTGISAGGFIIVVLLATAVNVVGIIAFLSCAIIFIARVLGLWLAMILAPIAFFSYTVPALRDMKMIGWKKWWPDTLKMAFLAPVFAFFMYLIVGFMDKGLGIINADSKTGMNFVVAMIVPFVFIMLLLMKAKSIAKDMSGEMGSAITKAGAIAGGVALGAATGGAAMLGRQTLGRAAANISQSNKFRDWSASHGRFGKIMNKAIGGVGAGSFDARGVKIAGKDLSSTGLKVGKNVKTGGFTKSREEKVKKEEEYANKMLDTSDYGMAQLTGQKGMSEKKKNKVIKQMGGNFGNTVDKNGKTVALNEQAFRAELQGGLNPVRARQVADQLNATRRGNRADYLSKSKFATSRIKGNKIRKDASAIQKQRDLAITMAAMVNAQKASESGSGKTTTTQKAEPEPKVEPSTPQK